MQCEAVPDHPVFDATLEVRIFRFEDVLNRDRLAKVLRDTQASQAQNVTFNLVKTMSKTILDTMTNANQLF